MNIFQLISVYAELNQPTLAYEKCISSKALLKQHNNYSRIITVDMFECITLTDLGLYNESKEKIIKDIIFGKQRLLKLQNRPNLS